jgi:hypothetical protein
MKRRLLRLSTAAALAVGLAVPMGAQPVQAVEPATVITAIEAVYSAWQKFAKGGGGTTLDQAIQQIKQAILTAQSKIIDEINLVAVASVRGCAESAVINFNDIEQLSPDNLQAFALDATACVTQAQSLIPAITGTPAAVDQAGFALNAVGPLALAARARAGLSTPTLTSVLASGNTSLVSALVPSCVKDDLSGGEPGVPHIHVWDCTAYNGDQAEVVIGGNPAARTTAENYAARNTSRAIAQAVLPQLTS